jgi:hypothetical protein
MTPDAGRARSLAEWAVRNKRLSSNFAMVCQLAVKWFEAASINSPSSECLGKRNMSIEESQYSDEMMLLGLFMELTAWPTVTRTANFLHREANETSEAGGQRRGVAAAPSGLQDMNVVHIRVARATHCE